MDATPEEGTQAKARGQVITKGNKQNKRKDVGLLRCGTNVFWQITANILEECAAFIFKDDRCLLCKI
jgi:hypothetical protein